MTERFILKASEDHPLKWVIFDSKYKIVMTFIESQFNETLKVTPLSDDLPEPDPLIAAKAMREISDWVAANHGYLIEVTPRTGIGQDLRVAMFDQEVTVDDLKEMTGLSRNTIQAILYGWYNYKIDALLALCNALNLDLNAEEYED